MANCDIAILGAGPYGLAAASHLKEIKGLEVRAFGEPMSFWDRNMPVGMFLRCELDRDPNRGPRRQIHAGSLPGGERDSGFAAGAA